MTETEVRENLLMENAMRCMEIFCEMQHEGIESLDKDKITSIDSLEIMHIFKDWAREFEDEYKDTPRYEDDYLELSDEYFREKLIDKFGKTSSRNNHYNKLLDRDFYEISDYDGVKYITVFGYIYVNGDGEYRDLEYSGFDMPLKEFLDKKLYDRDAYDEYQETLKQYIGDITEREAYRRIEQYMATDPFRVCDYKDLTMFTECGYYIEGER